MKGKKMSGHYGQELVTIQNLPIVDIDLSKNLILIKGSVPGPKNSLVIIKTTNRVKNFKKMSNIVKNSKVENQNIDAAA
jgi:large subunit ribosomal protein L3